MCLGILTLGADAVRGQSTGSVVGWGGQVVVEPEALTDFIAVAGGGIHSLGLKSDSTILAWGWNDSGQCNVPSPNAGFIAVSGGYYHSLGLKADGTIAAWGRNTEGQRNVPSPNADFMAAAAGGVHSLGLKVNGTIAAWGDNRYGQCDVPVPNADFVAVAAGPDHSLGLKSDGTIVAWGWNREGQCNVPDPNADFIAVSAGGGYSLGIRSEHSNAVLFSSLAADSREGAIVLEWGTAADEALKGFRLYRAPRSGDFSSITASPLSPSTRTYEDRAIEPGKEYRYTVAALTLDGREIRSPEVIARGVAPSLALDQNAPNPFNPRTTIGFSLPGSEHVRLDIYDPGGRLVKRLIDTPMRAGHHRIEWNGMDAGGRAVASGVYFYRLTVGKQTSSKKMILLR